LSLSGRLLRLVNDQRPAIDGYSWQERGLLNLASFDFEADSEQETDYPFSPEFCCIRPA